MPLEPGDRLGPYEIQALLGVGGMGEVYRGRDDRLGRDVALKVISPKLIDSPAHRRRFEVEARAASALNHPAIVTIYDVGDANGMAWIAMEWVEGRTLRDALAGGALPVREAWSIIRSIADALAAAHAKNIVHRDLKPENVMLAPDGRVKVLDFGLARQTLGERLERSASAVETAAPPPNATFEGAILGTVGYMSPEQAAGRPVDFRSDQFALGLLAYETLTGKRAFARATAVETLSAVIREEPVPLASLRDDVPERLQRVIGRCLAKLPEHRFASTRDLVAALDSLATPSVLDVTTSHEARAASERATTPRTTERRRIGVSTIVAACVLAVAAAAALYRFGASPRAIDSLAVLPFENVNMEQEGEYLGDALTESLIDRMSRIPSLRVMARATAFRFRARDPQESGRRLGVGAVLTGTVSKRGDRIVVSAELIDIATGSRLWGETYDRPAKELLEVQDSIAADIADRLHLRLSGEQKRALAEHGTDNPEAYELYLKANVLLPRDTEEDDIEARRLYERAVELDPRFVDAHVNLATTYVRSAGNGYAPPAEAWARADEIMRNVQSLAPDNIRVRAMRASRRFLAEWDWVNAERDFVRLIADPLLYRGPQFHPAALFFWAVGRPEQSVAIVERALQEDPWNAESRVMMGDFLAQAGRLDDAERTYKALRDANPGDPRPLFGLAELRKRRGDAPGAIAALRQAYELTGEEVGVTALAAARTEADYEKAELAVTRQRLATLEEHAELRYVSPLELARLYAQTGDRDKAFGVLDLAIAERSPGLALLKADRAWDGIRDDGRFAALVRRVGIP